MKQTKNLSGGSFLTSPARNMKQTKYLSGGSFLTSQNSLQPLSEHEANKKKLRGGSFLTSPARNMKQTKILVEVASLLYKTAYSLCT
jgi:hypothetical protein